MANVPIKEILFFTGFIATAYGLYLCWYYYKKVNAVAKEEIVQKYKDI